MEVNLTRELIRSLLWICISVNSEKLNPLPTELLTEYERWLSIRSQETGIPIKRCHRCMYPYLPDPRHIRDQKYCYFGCRERMCREKRRERNKRYRKSRKYKFTKSGQNHRYRARDKAEDQGAHSAVTPKRPSLSFIIQRVVDVVRRFFPRLSQKHIEWIHTVIHHEIKIYKGERIFL